MDCFSFYDIMLTVLSICIVWFQLLMLAFFILFYLTIYLICFVVQRFESQMSSKQPAYCLVRRLGVALCNRCDKEDPEREQLTEMLCSLGTLWHKMRAVAAQRSVSVCINHEDLNSCCAVQTMFTFITSMTLVLSVSQSVSKGIYAAQLSRMSYCAREATLKPIRFQFMPKTVITNVLILQVCWEAVPNTWPGNSKPPITRCCAWNSAQSVGAWAERVML